MELKSKTETIELTELFNGYSLFYRYQLIDGKLEGGQVSGEARIETEGGQTSRIVKHMHTQDGSNFSHSTTETMEDNFDELSAKMKADLKQIFDAPENYLQ